MQALGPALGQQLPGPASAEGAEKSWLRLYLRGKDVNVHDEKYHRTLASSAPPQVPSWTPPIRTGGTVTHNT